VGMERKRGVGLGLNQQRQEFDFAQNFLFITAEMILGNEGNSILPDLLEVMQRGALNSIMAFQCICLPLQVLFL